MTKSNVETNAEIARTIAVDPSIVGEVGALATDWASRMAEGATIGDQLAATAACYRQVLPKGATPTAILRGDYGRDEQRAFLDGALMAVNQYMIARLV